MNKCVEFCHALATSEKKFTFTLNIETETFKYNTSLKSSDLELKNSTGLKKKKKKSPSQLRREAKRKEERIKKKESEEAAEKAVANKTPPKDLPQKCNICDKIFNSENGLKIHKGKTHGTERLRSLSNQHDSSLKVSPEKDSQRKEPEEDSADEGELTEGMRVSSLIPCDSCVALFEHEEDMKDHLQWCRDSWNPNSSRPGPDTGPAD